MLIIWDKDSQKKLNLQIIAQKTGHLANILPDGQHFLAINKSAECGSRNANY